MQVMGFQPLGSHINTCDNQHDSQTSLMLTQAHPIDTACTGGVHHTLPSNLYMPVTNSSTQRSGIYAQGCTESAIQGMLPSQAQAAQPLNMPVRLKPRTAPPHDITHLQTCTCMRQLNMHHHSSTLQYMYTKLPVRLHRPSQHSNTQNLVHKAYMYTAQLQATSKVDTL